MPGRLSSMFAGLEGARAALIAYATAYYPSREASAEVIRTMLESGADAVEIGIPFSDPVMDGPVIQETSRIALTQGSTTSGILKLAAELRAETEKPLLLMSYYNPIFKYGLDSFARDAAEAGVDGVVIPDLPFEEMGPWKSASDKAGLETVAFVSVTTSDSRIAEASRMTSGFLYCVSLLGTTGPRKEVSPEVYRFIERVRRNASCPLALGIGISTPEQCADVGKIVDGVIVGSALMQTVSPPGDDLGKLESLVRELSGSLAE